MIPLIISGIYMGEMVGFSFSGVLVESHIIIDGVSFGGWPSIFYVFGLLGLLWFPWWTYAAYESPTIHPYITEEELAYMKEGTYQPTYLPTYLLTYLLPVDFANVSLGWSSMKALQVVAYMHGFLYYFSCVCIIALSFCSLHRSN
jgi:hypothetical protein